MDAKLKDWKEENDVLTKGYTFSSFADVMGFVNKVADLAEEVNHHPNILIYNYKKVRISLTTHDIGKITDLDYSLAAKIEDLI